ncbi:hypothetical protein NQ317_011675 [Molorchus minor]|uniref:SET domain-containing protein n=1 Tax=Molorchus minor TaxID=1323400 RepID=A0ABQ9JHS0_9CUCU|nr:hypothetical protein NQ317_011675 [Molorchus minor]
MVKKKHDVFRSDRYQELHTYFKTYDDVINTTILFFNAAHAKEIYYNIKDRTTLLQELNMSEIEVTEFIYCNLIISLITSIEIHEDKDGVNEPFSGGIYSFLSRYNHSCAPNCRRTYHGKIVAVRAVKDIKKGEQCFISYGPNYATVGFHLRQEFLKIHFSFICECKACKNRWPCFDYYTHKEVFHFLATLPEKYRGLQVISEITSLVLIWPKLKQNMDVYGNLVLDKLFKLQQSIDEPLLVLCIVEHMILFIMDQFGNRPIQS